MLLICSCFHPRPSSVPVGTRSQQGDAAATECRASGTRRSVRSPVLRYLLTCFEIWLRAVLFLTLVLLLLSIVSLSMFSSSVAVLLRRKIFAKLIHHFDISKFLTKFFLFSLRTSARGRFRFSRRAGLVPESECKITAFFFNHQIFSDLFSDYFSHHGASSWKLDQLN